MKIQFLGATGDVTGSAYLVTTRKASVLVDCGLYQGGRELRAKNRQSGLIESGRLDAVVLTHAHLDHIGRLPMLVKHGYQGPIFGTRPTFEIGKLILRDALFLQKGELERENRRRERQGLEPLEPMYEEEHVTGLKPLLRQVRYGKPVEVAPGVQARFVDAGHVIGSSSIELTVTEGSTKRVIVFSGDLGPRGAPLLEDPTPFRSADVVVMESTYGDRTHRSLADTAIEARGIIAKAVEERAKILVPVFAVGRTQLLLYLLAGAFKNKQLPRFPIYLDSPMAIKATKVYGDNAELFDEEAKAMVRSGELRRQLQSVKACPSAKDSMALNNVRGPCMIMAGSGMCSGGRILHHLRHNLHRPETAVMIVGYQSPGTLGRQLVDGDEFVTIFGERILVRAAVHTLGGFSAHADQDGLLEWVGSIAPSKPRVIITHGEDRARKALATLIRSRYGLKSERPNLGDRLEL